MISRCQSVNLRSLVLRVCILSSWEEVMFSVSLAFDFMFDKRKRFANVGTAG